MTLNNQNLSFQSWGRFPKALNQGTVSVPSRFHNIPKSNNRFILPYGMGRSYGDSCLNDEGQLLLTRSLDNLIHFDDTTGMLRAESGVTLADILEFAVPRGFFLPVTPGTKFVTLGGAVANDVHGKNHHVDGTIAHHITQFELLRSNGERFICSREQNYELFCATIGGLGLTGLITWVEIKLRPVHNAFISQEVIKTSGLSDFFELSSASAKDFAYTVSWVDCLAKGSQLGRGLFIRGNHCSDRLNIREKNIKPKKKTVPFDFPSFVLSTPTVKAFNTLYYHKQLQRLAASTVHYDPFFYPLDAIHHWNRIYGKRGFLQWQCVVPFTGNGGEDAIRAILDEISRARLGSFLAVLKTFGDIPSPGMMSFPKEGITLALDFPNSGKPLLDLLERLDRVTCDVRGSVYAAKDARMSPTSFQIFYPRFQEFSQFIDPAFSSSFWRRVTRKM